MTAQPGAENGSAADRRPVVVGVDGSEKSKDALTWAARWAALSGVDLLAVIIWHYPTMFGWAPPWPDGYDPGAEANQLLQDTVRQVLGASPAISVTTRVFEGAAAPTLVELSKEASLIVVGSRGHGEFAGMLIGSVSEFLAGHAHCPVVIIRN
ncbi:MAG TPA: universal stress protein UspA [Acidimicrobiaceae bacterium]|nr:universal stress protein UspA [Acidimicrobiaceae bacterium]